MLACVLCKFGFVPQSGVNQSSLLYLPISTFNKSMLIKYVSLVTLLSTHHDEEKHTQKRTDGGISFEITTKNKLEDYICLSKTTSFLRC